MYLQKIKGFDSKEFFEDYYQLMDKERLAYIVITNIIKYAHKTQHISKGQFAQFMADILEDDEIFIYCDDDILNNEQIQIKKEWKGEDKHANNN